MKELIMVVDDNPSNVELLVVYLKNAGYDTVTASNGLEALQLLQDTKPNLLLLDVMMPEMDGFHVCRQMQNDKELKKIPVIFLTALSDTDDVVRGFDVGGVDYVIKPFKSKELLARVHTHVELRKAREENKVLRGIVPICTQCHKVREDSGYWDRVEDFISKNSEAQISESLCPECTAKLYGTP